MKEKWKYTESSIGLRMFVISLSFSNLVDLIAAQDALLSIKVAENERYARPEQTLLQVFAKSFDASDIDSVSAECRRDSAIYRAALFKYKSWALQMYDSSTKIPSAVISGNYQQLGNYDECLKARSDHDFVGKACSARVQFSITNSCQTDEFEDDEPDMNDLLLNVIRASGFRNRSDGQSDWYEFLWCVPSSCNAQDVEDTIEVALKPLRRSPEVEFTVTVGKDSCHTEETDRTVLDVADCIYIALLVLFGIVIVASTAYDLVKRRNLASPDLKDQKHKIITSFSVYTNGKSLFDLKRSADSIDCLDSIRFMSICWIVHAHSGNLELDGNDINFAKTVTMYERWHTLFFLNNNITTDTFFLLSGLLLAYSEMGRKKKNPESYKLNFLSLYIHRYIRLTPSYAMVIDFFATLFNKFGSGPRWNDVVGTNRYFCKKNWWTNILYINNYIDVWDMCIPPSWYVAADMQMVWLSPIFLYPMLANGRKSQIIFFVLLAIALLASILVPFFITYCQRLTGTMVYYKDSSLEKKVFSQIYLRAYTRGGPYLIGLGLGYFFRRYQSTKVTIPTSIVIAGWIIAVAAGLAVIFGPREFYLPDHKYNPVEAAFYAGFHRHAFAFAVGWVIVTSTFGYAGPVGSFLSWRIWGPLSKLTYSTYLLHYIFLLYNIGIVRTPTLYTIYSSIHSLFGTLVLTLLLSTILCICFEMPFCRLSQVLIQRNRQPIAPSARYNLNKGPSGENRESNSRIYGAAAINSSYLSNSLEFMNRSLETDLASRQEADSFALSTSSTIDFSSIYNEKTNNVWEDFEAAEVPDAKKTETSNGDNLGFVEPIKDL